VLACVEKRGELRWVVGYSLGGERWDGEEEGEEEEERKAECRQRQYNILDLPTASPTENSVGKTVGDSAGVSDTSLFGFPGLNPSVFPSVNAFEKNPRHPAVAISKNNFSPSVILPVYTDGIIPSVYTGGITDGCFPSVNSDRF
jgi:hypothetical protein